MYRVKAVSPTGVSQWSSYVSVDTPAAPSPTPEPNPEPGPDPDPENLAPSGLSAKAVSGDDGVIEGVALAWDAPAEDAASVTGYEILRAVGDGDLAPLVADTASPATTYADDTATEAGESYAYRVKALRGEEASQPSDRAVAIIPKVTAVEPEPPIAERQSGDARVPADWSLIPSGLGEGDRFRLIFLSSIIRNATATDIADYNTWIQNLAANGHADIQQYSSTFRVVGSTAVVDARDNTNTTYTNNDKGVAIYWLGGNKVADDYEGFYDGEWDDEANVKDQSGNNRSTSGSGNRPFTGSDHDGTESLSGSVSRALGATQVRLGRLNDASGGPLSSSSATSNSNFRPFYGLSEVFLIVSADAEATLSALSLSDSMLSPSFAVDTLTYTGSVRNVVSMTTVTATPHDDGATVAIVPADADDVTDGHQVALPVGDTAISVTVTAENGTTMQTYTVTVTRAEAQEEAVTTVPADWGLTPSGLGAGARFRLLFLSSGTRDAIPIAIADYDTWIQNLAANGHADIQQYSSTFRVVGSTAVVDARDNTNTTYTNNDKGVAIYWLGGNKVADDYEGFYDGEWDDEANVKDQSGNNRSTSGSTNRPFTGSGHDGTESFNFSNASRALGASSVRLGRPNDASGGPLSSGNTTSNFTVHPLYGLSGVFVVSASADASADARLSALSLSGITLSPSFAADTLAYTASVDNAVDSTTVTATANDDGATLEITPGDADDTTDGHQVALGVGDTTVSVTVTATDGASMQTYAVTVTRAEPVEVESITMRRYDSRDGEPYRIGDQMVFVVKFSHVVWCVSQPPNRLRFHIGTSRKEAGYLSGFGSDNLWYRYTVQEGDLDTDGITIPPGPEALPDEYRDSCTAGTTFDESGVTAQGPLEDRKVDGVRPTVAEDGLQILLTFSEPLHMTTAPASAFTLAVNTGTAPAVNSATASGDKVTLGLAGALTSGQAVTVTYTDPMSDDDDDAVQDVVGNDAETFTTGEGDVPAVANAVGTGCSVADGCYLVSADWGLIPNGLGAGAEFRLIFISSGTRDGSSTDIADYNTFVQDAAAAGHTDIQGRSSTFRVVGSTAADDARDNTATRYTGDDTAATDDDSDLGVPIYWLGGAKVADEYKDFYDGDWDDEATAKDESGSDRSFLGFNNWAITGSKHDGTEAFSGSNSRGLGASNVQVGVLSSPGNGPLNSSNITLNTTSHPLYSLSPVFRVEGQATTITVPVETTPVPTTWSLVPSGLGDGDSFRLLFIGSSNRDAISSDIAVYNTFVQNLVDTNGHADIQAHSATFRVLGSTEDVDARDNTGTTGTGVPIYWLNGAKVADNYADFYDGSWNEEATGARETGVSVSIASSWKIWTGSAQDGTEAMNAGGTESRALGNSGNHWVMQGSPNGSDSAHGPIESDTATRNTHRGLYGLSGVFTVDASLDAVNNPPEFSADTDLRTVPENSPTGTSVGDPVTATDDDGDTLTYTLEGDDALSFGIDSSSGQIQTIAGVTYDHEGTFGFLVTVKADDGKEGTDTIIISIGLTDVDEPPSVMATPTVTPVTGSSDSLDVSWTAPDNSGKPDIESYDLQYRQGDHRRLDRRPAGRDGPQRHPHRAGRRHGVPGAGAGDQRRGRRRLVGVGHWDHERRDQQTAGVHPSVA